MRIAQMLLVGSSLLLAAGCATTDRHMADRALESNLHAEMLRYGDLAANDPNVHIYARDGVVTLRGQVRTQKDRDMLESLVRNSTGVVAVNDELGIMYPPTGAQNGYAVPVYESAPPVITSPAPIVTPRPRVIVRDYPNVKLQAETTSDQSVAGGIALQLRTDSFPQNWFLNVTISVNNGYVSLQGFVDTQEQRHALISSIRRVGGVKAIYDQLQVR